MPNRSGMKKINKGEVYIPSGPYSFLESGEFKDSYLVVSLQGEFNIWMTKDEIDILNKQGYLYVNRDNIIKLEEKKMTRSNGFVCITKSNYGGFSGVSPKAKIPCVFEDEEKFIKKVAFVKGSDLIQAGAEKEFFDEDDEYTFAEFEEYKG
jgi:hypothetical protein